MAKGKQTLGNNILMRSIKIVDIGYITVLYIAIAIVCAKLVDKIFGEFDENIEKEKTKLRLSLEMIGAVWAYGVLIYVVRNVVELIPFPLDQYHGFEHQRVKELKSATVFTFTFLMFSNILKNKVLYFYKSMF
jgi:hypothetical protein